MFLVPYEKLELHSRLTPVEAARHLDAVVERHHAWLKPPPAGKQFYGSVSPQGFSLVSAIRGMNTYLPRVSGRIRPEPGGSVISVVVTLHPVAVTLVVLFFGWFSVLSLRAGSSVAPPLLLFAAFHVVMYFVGFLPEVRAARVALLTVLAAA